MLIIIGYGCKDSEINKPKMSISTLIHQKMVDFCRINAQYYAYYKRITNAIF